MAAEDHQRRTDHSEFAMRYADELDAEASQLETQASSLPAQAIPGAQPDNGAVAALEAVPPKAAGQSD
jgi:hypothetical protein